MHRQVTESGVDVAVLGGGPAGLAAALALRRHGLRVAVYDALRPPIDKACGEGLMPEAVRLLGHLGLTLGGAAPFDGISFHNAHNEVRAEFRDGSGLGVRRTHLQEKMAALAEQRGVTLHWGASVRRNAHGGFESVGERIQADFFVIADGQCSTLAGACGFRERACHSVRYASRQHFARAAWSRLVEVHWGLHEQLYITPLVNAQVGVALLTSQRGRTLRDALPAFPAVAERLAGAPATSTTRGAISRTRSLHQVVRGNVALLGDASGSVDAVTGEGLLSALRQAVALADALAKGRPQLYAAAHRHLSVLPERMARSLLLLDRHPWLERRVLAGFAARPEIFSAMLRVHLGEQTLPRFVVEHGPALLAAAWFAERGGPWPLQTPLQDVALHQAALHHAVLHRAALHAASAERERGL